MKFLTVLHKEFPFLSSKEFENFSENDLECGVCKQIAENAVHCALCQNILCESHVSKLEKCPYCNKVHDANDCKQKTYGQNIFYDFYS